MDKWLQHSTLTCDGCRNRGLVGGLMSFGNLKHRSNTSDRHCRCCNPPSLPTWTLSHHRHLSFFRYWCWITFIILKLINNKYRIPTIQLFAWQAKPEKDSYRWPGFAVRWALWALPAASGRVAEVKIASEAPGCQKGSRVELFAQHNAPAGTLLTCLTRIERTSTWLSFEERQIHKTKQSRRRSHRYSREIIVVRWSWPLHWLLWQQLVWREREWGNREKRNKREERERGGRTREGKRKKNAK